MTLADWVRNSIHYVREYPPRRAAAQAGGELYQGAMQRVACRLPNRGTPVYQHDWDVLVVLDACRVDALEAVASEFRWLPEDIQTSRSVGSMSEEWMEQFEADRWGDEMAETAHITWNAFESHVLDGDNWSHLDGVWNDVWEDGCVPPDAITDRGIQRWREADDERMILHYQQPHRPYKSLRCVERPTQDEVGQRNTHNTTVWDLLRAGEISPGRVWQAYLDNLHLALQEVDRLRQNLDAGRVLLTADHGECFGEYGFHGHPRGVRLSELVDVPLVEIGAADHQTAQPTPAVSDAAGDVDDRLEALGYK